MTAEDAAERERYARMVESMRAAHREREERAALGPLPVYIVELVTQRTGRCMSFSAFADEEAAADYARRLREGERAAGTRNRVVERTETR